MAETPTHRTLKELRKDGYLAEVAEYWLPSHAQRGVVSAAQDFCSGAMTKRDLQAAVNAMKKFGPGRRRDLFDFIDVVAIGKGSILAVQCTSRDNVSSRVHKIVLECGEAAKAWLSDRGSIEVWGWRELPEPVQRKKWWPYVKQIRLTDRGALSAEVDETRLTPAERDSQLDLPF